MDENKIDHIRWLISMIEGYDLDQPFDVLYNYVGNLLNGFPTLLLALNIPRAPFDRENPGDAIGCFRTRRIDSLDDIKCDDDLWAKPKLNVKHYGRCHGPNQEVLYCSSMIGVTLYELDLRKDDLFVVMHYVSKTPDESLDFTALGEDRYHFEDNEIVNANGIESIYGRLSKKNREKYRTIEKFILRSFRKKVDPDQNEKYKITSAITNFYFHEPGNPIETIKEKAKIRGVLYPSVKLDQTAYNFAFENQAAKDHLEIAGVYVGKVLDFNSEGYRISLDSKLERSGYNGAFVWSRLDS